jgi:hypothetical protein
MTNQPKKKRYLTAKKIAELRKLALPPDDQERLNRFRSILQHAGSELLALAEEGHSSIALAAEALAWKFLAMARLNALSEIELCQIRLLEFADEYDWDPKTWKFGREFLRFTGYDSWRDQYIEGLMERNASDKIIEEARSLMEEFKIKRRMMKRGEKKQIAPDL